MNPEIKKAWIEALRDPNAKQIIGGLENKNGNCCLGLLCNIAVKHGVITKTKLYGASWVKFGANNTGYLPNEVVDRQ